MYPKTTTTMLEVTHEQFFEVIYRLKLDVNPHAQSPYYQQGVAGLSLWKMRNGELIGRTCSDINHLGNTLYPVVNRYYFTTAFAQKVGIPIS